VSGGSLYAYYIGRELKDRDWNASSDLFDRVLANRWTGMQNLGRWAFASYLRGDSIATFGPITWALDFFSDTSYRTYLTRGLEFGGYLEPLDFRTWGEQLRSWHNPFVRRRIRSGELVPSAGPRSPAPPLPRFYFNATMLESGAPFTFTSRITNLRPPRVPHRTARPDLPDGGCESDGEPTTDAGAAECRRQGLRRPLQHSLTPEDFGNDPGQIFLGVAAVASAAFPFAVDPMVLRRFDLRAPGDQVVGTDEFVSLSDGGVFDNSGLTTAVDLYDYLQRYRNVDHLILIAINADADRYRENVGDDATNVKGPSPVGVGVPLPTLFTGADSLNLIHYSNKRRAELLAWKQLVQIVARKHPEIESDARALSAKVQASRRKQPAGTFDRELSVLNGDRRRQVEAVIAQTKSSNAEVTALAVADAYRRARASDYVHYFPVDLSQLSSADPHAIPNGQSDFDAASTLATTFWTYDSDDFVLSKAAERILTTEQDSAWRVGPSDGEVRRLDDAVAHALLRSASGRWRDDYDGRR
jgi:hypothetical protein